MRRTNKVISIIILICMMVTMMPLQAFAEEEYTYTVKYLEQGTGMMLEAPKIVTSQVLGTVVTESAIDIEGYVKQDSTSQLITIGESDNVIDFYYKVRTDIDYVVNYLDVVTNELVAEQKIVTWQVFGNTVTEMAIDLESYIASQIEQTITLGVGGNVINFYYIADEPQELYYTFNYYLTGNIFATESRTVEKANPVVNSVSHENKPVGYKLDTINSTALPFTVTESENVINVYYIAQYSENDPIVIKYTVNFVDYNGTVLKTEEVESGKGATAPTVATRNGYTFTGWNKAFDNIVEDTTVTAQYIIETGIGIGTVILRFEDEDGNELLSEDIITDLELGEYTFNAPILEGYTADFDSETVTIEYDGDVRYIVFTYTVIEIDFTPQLRIVYADCQDIQDEDESLDIFVERSLNEEHNVMEEVYYDLTVGENIIKIPTKYNNLELQFTGKVDWDSEIEIETTEENEQEKTIKIYLPYLTSLNYFAGYVKPEEIIIEEPIVEEPVIDKPRKNNSIPKAEDFIPNLKDIKQEDFIARWLEHKSISKELKKFYNEEVKFKISIAEFKELKKEGLEPRVYKWNKEKEKLIAEATVIEEGIEVVTIKHPTVLENNTNEYYAVFAVKQPIFEDVNEKDSNFKITDKANGLGIIEGIEKDSKIYFEADKEISKSEFYTMVARIFGAMPEGEMKMYDILDFNTMEEANEILEGFEVGLDDWAKPYVASLLGQGYITISDLKDNQFNFSRDFNLVEKLFSVAEKKKNTFNFVEGDTREAVVENLIEMLEIYEWQ